jgi:predicted dienelactone hydrolase
MPHGVIARHIRRVSRGPASLVFLVVAGVSVLGAGQPAGANRIDTIAPMAPELAPYGSQASGVRTIVVTDRHRPDIRNTKPGAPTVFADRRLTLEVWYPASLPASVAQHGTYRALVRDGKTTVTLHGRAVRDAAPAAGPFPLVILSHGHPGSRYLMSHLGENLASKGYVVVSIDHTDSTYEGEPLFASTLYHRPFDQLFVLNEVARLSAPGSGSFLSGRVDVLRTGIVGYSMGGYGVVNVIGGGFTDAAVASSDAPPNRLLGDRGASNPTYRTARDPRIKAAIAIGPWGMQRGYWDADGLAGITTPVLFVAGSADDVSGYEKGTRAIFEGAVNADRYLLTFTDANHNAAAPYPAPAESVDGPATAAFAHHADAVWDTVRMNNILQHFATAYFGRHLQGNGALQSYFDVVPRGRDAVWATDREGRVMPEHNYWKGFKRGTARGLVLEHLPPAGESRGR